MANSFSIFMNKQFQNIAVSHFNTTLGMCLLIPILPVYLQNSGFAETQIGIIMGATAISALIIRPWIGFQVDSKGSRPVILIGQMLLIVSTIGYWWAASFLAFFVLRLLYGMGQAFYGTGAVTFASSIGTGESNSNSIAMYTLTTMFGLGLSMSMAQVAFDNFGFNALVGISAVLIGIAFSVMKLRSKPIKLASFSFSAILTFIPLAAIDKGVQFYSLFFIAFAISVISSRVFVQKINQKLGLVNATVYSSITMLLSILLLLVTISPIILIFSGILFGLGFGVVYPSLVLLLVDRINQTNRGTALGIMIAAGDIGNALSTAILGGVAEYLGYSALFSTTALLLAVCTYYFYAILVKHDEKMA